jgi:hypothetical protein
VVVILFCFVGKPELFRVNLRSVHMRRGHKKIEKLVVNGSEEL